MHKPLIASLALVAMLAAGPAQGEQPLKIGIAAMVSPVETIKYYRQLIEYVGVKLGRPVAMIQRENYDEMDRMLETTEVSIAFICSGPYVLNRDRIGLDLLAAPQCCGRSSYHAYLIVHKDSPTKDLAGLRGKRFAFTDAKSNTGCLVPTFMIAREFNSQPEKFFSEIVYTGTHDKSLETVARKLVDGASVDSLIYDYAARKNPQFTAQTRIIRTSPPYGMPPVVTRRDMDPALRAQIQGILLNMHRDPAGKEILDGIMVDRFVTPKDAEYDTVREMADWISGKKRSAPAQQRRQAP